MHLHPKASRHLLATALASALMLAGPTGAAAGDLSPARATPATVDQMIVKFRSAVRWQDKPALQAAVERLRPVAERHGVTLSALREMAVGAKVLRLDKPLAVSAAARLAKELAALPEVEYAEPDRILQALATNDPLYPSQWHYHEPVGGINLEAGWAQADGSGVVVAVIDTGYRPHADLVANLLPGYDFISSASRARDGNGRDADASDQGDWGRYLGLIPLDSSWHGTHVAGTVAAATNNGIGVAGIAYNAKVMPVRVLGKDGGATSDIADAVVWASGGHVAGVPDTATPARVLNLSLGGSGSCGAAMQSAIEGATSRGTVVVVAAGNGDPLTGKGIDARNTTPANCDGVITVAATGRNGGRASYSNFGAVVEIAAPGGNGSDYVWSTYNDGKKKPGKDSYAGEPFQGTSMAAPHVAGVAALMLSKNPSLTPDQVSNILRSSARPFPAACDQCGAGIVDAGAALAATPAR